MTWLAVIVLALVCLALLIFVFKAPRGTWEAIASALLLGVAGYALQGSPGLSGTSKESSEPSAGRDAAAMVEARAKVSNRGIPDANKWVVIADGQARHGQYGTAAEVLRGAIEADPKNSEAWLAMANALLAHADGQLTAPTLYAYRRAALADPDAPGPPFFLGLAFVQNGQFADARALWAGVVERAPANAKWKPLLARQIAALDALIAAQKQAGSSAGAQPGAQPPLPPATSAP
ncbi:tetratricopeptide TPR 4 [Novosphingobium sp. Rr 2-17]|uniref:tetratricopeptide repeat protein n=1 Tax=Novosphingobium sp. Rr 2-17 TaxID=555793 RepID=UPI0002699260|nr:tetratricopeptide repeat protein [Novosphingobium sp. Rr 2-17]EIZ77554.1 tetratricopeptide TPR 4 [Novosphingobium sp. Rr 2-17]